MPYHLFEVTGVELEYMIVDARTLSVAPIADSLLTAAAGSVEEDAVFGPVTWSNELTRHVIEFKTTDPATELDEVAQAFQSNVEKATELLAKVGARLMPGGMHPWMNPDREMQLWPHGYSEVYQAFDRIFGCKGHGWANLQSMHVNLPFSGDEEFGRLHAAIRMVLPILPALAASSPIMESRTTGLMDNRLEVYRNNSKKIPSMAGKVIPEPVFTEAEYRAQILERLWNDLAPHDPAGTLRDEWANARGCIARFSRGSIEIRVIDVQECPAADLAICAAVTGLIKHLATSPKVDQSKLRAWDVEPLSSIFLSCVRDADEAVIDNADYLKTLNVGTKARSAAELWNDLLDSAGVEQAPELETILSEGCLARRMLRFVGIDDASPAPEQVDEDAIVSLADAMCDSLENGEMLTP